MGISDWFKSKPRVERDQIATLAAELDRRLRVTREQFLFSVVSTIEGEGGDVAEQPKQLQSGTEIDAALCGFQLTNVTGFAWSYMDRSLCEDFDAALTKRLENGQAEFMSQYRERYLDCEGNIDNLNKQLATDIHQIWGKPEPTQRFLAALTVGAKLLGVLSQASVARAVGDEKTETKLRRLIS